MLPLEDPRWGELTAFFSDKSLPAVVGEWLASLGIGREEEVYSDLYNRFLHQNSIANAAFAVVPWLVDVCETGGTEYRADYLTDVALVEAHRIKYGLYYHRDGTEEYPQWLMADYRQALDEARILAEGVVRAEQDDQRKRGLLTVMPALEGDADQAWLDWHGPDTAGGIE